MSSNNPNTTTQKVIAHSLFTDFDIDLFKAGKHFRLYQKLGAHLTTHNGHKGVVFSVWAPNAKKVGVISDFNGWDDTEYQLFPRWDSSGIWEGFIPHIEKGALYKYKIVSNNGGQELEKADPFAQYAETPPKTASVVWDLGNTWSDAEWMKTRAKNNGLNQPVSVYEVHLGSWRRKWNEAYRSYHYTELADELVSYVKEAGFTHVEFMPVMEHPFFGSWGYQITGYFAPSARFGTPQEFMHLVDAFHQAGIGVFLDWVPSHFPSDAHGLYQFDGTALYEHADPRQGYHPDWSSYIFNYGRNEIKSFLISNALFWLDKYHVDGLRVDAVASMLYLDYSRKDGEWVPNKFGGRENLDAIDFMRLLNENVYANYPDVQTIAEESTAFPMVTKPTYIAGLGFGMKWMMGWMNDTLEYFKKDAFYRQWHQNNITFSTTYAFTENFMLPLSHDEVVHGKGSLYNRMPGDDWQKLANLRLLYAYMYTHSGTKLLFMGSEFGQVEEWKHDHTLQWNLLDRKENKGLFTCIQALNSLYKNQPALYELSFEAQGFEWIDYSDAANSVICYIRKSENPADDVIVICNFTPVPRENYCIGVLHAGTWSEIFNSDAEKFGGSGVLNSQPIVTQDKSMHYRDNSITLTLPPLGVVVLKR